MANVARTLIEYTGQQPLWRNSTSAPLVCYSYSMIPTGTVWRGQNPLEFSYPLLLLDLLIILLTTRAAAFLLRPLGQPRFLAELLSGVLLGPTAMGCVPGFTTTVFPLRGVLILESLSLLGVVYFIFIIAVELDLSLVLRHAGHSAAVAVACFAVPSAVGAFYSMARYPEIIRSLSGGSFLAFLAASLSITAFSVLARSLAEHKLLSTPVGATALSAAMIVDGCAWIMLALAVALAQNAGHLTAMLWTAVTGALFLVTQMLVVRPAVGWLAERAEEGEEVDETHACTILVGVLVSATVADAIGIHAVTGAVVFGMMIPSGRLGAALVERVEDFVEGMLLPLFFAVIGLRTNLWAAKESKGAGALVTVVLVAAAVKVVGCLVVARVYKMPLRDGLVIGLLMNTKGIIEMVMLNIGRDKQILMESTFSVLVLTSMSLTAVLSPILAAVATSPLRRSAPHRRRTVEWHDPDSELRLVVCVHGPRHVPTVIGLVEISNPTKRTPVFVCSLHLIQLTGRASAMLIINNNADSDRAPLGSETISHAFDVYEQHAAGVTVQSLAAVSPYATMHLDVCRVAEETHAALVILPFHKQLTIDGTLAAANPSIRALNESVLASPPCSVGVLVDRGLGGAVRIAPGQQAAHHIAVVFLGGPDDREALIYASRMAEHPGVSLTVLRLLASGERERVLQDEECVSEFRVRHASRESVVYKEMEISNGEETLEAVRSMDSIHDLYIVGRGRGRESPLTAGLIDWSECPELGPIGDLLSSSDFSGTASVLVVQRCPTAEEVIAPPPWEAPRPESPCKKLKISPTRGKIVG